MTIQNLRRKLNEQKNRVGLVSGTVEIQEYDETDHYISAYIAPDGWKINVSIKKGFDPIKDKRQKAYARAKKIDDGLETLVMHVGGLHEPAHWELPVDSERGCPYNLYWHDKILQSVKEALPQDKKNLSSFIVNSFEDMIINPRCREWNKEENNGDYSGQVLFWDWEGIKLKEKGKAKYTLFYEAFVKLNMHLWGDKLDKSLVKRHYSNDKKVNEAVEKTIKDLNLPEDIQNTAKLFNKEKWVEMSKKFTLNLYHLLEEPLLERFSAFSPNPNEGEGDEFQCKVGNGIEEKMKTKEGKEEIATGRYSSRESPSSNLTNYEQLDALYRSLSRSIPVSVEAISRQQSMEVAPLNYRAFDPETDNISKVKTSKIFVDANGISLGYVRQPIVIDQKSKIQRKSFPNFKMIVLDNSASMQENPDGGSDSGSKIFVPWGDKSKYHYALLGFYGIENFLTRQGIAQYIDHGVSMFSDSTSYKGGNFQDLDSVRKFVLSPQFGHTYIDSSVLKKALDGRESFVLSISDGEIQNWSSQRDSIKKLVDENYYAHIQIGDKNIFTEDLKSWGVPVSYVNAGEDLSKLMVNVTKDCYRKFTK